MILMLNVSPQNKTESKEFKTVYYTSFE